jgi:alpha-tubulin suppressor-like RCC1 family protein
MDILLEIQSFLKIQRKPLALQKRLNLQYDIHTNLTLSTHSIFILSVEDNDLYVWGHGADGKLGTGNTNNQFTPIIPKAFEDIKVVDVAASDSHSFVIMEPSSSKLLSNSVLQL